MNVEKLKTLVAGMREHAAGGKNGPWYDQAKWSALCDALEACAEDAPPEGARKAADDLGKALGAAVPLLCGGQPVSVNVYVTCNGK